MSLYMQCLTHYITTPVGNTAWYVLDFVRKTNASFADMADMYTMQNKFSSIFCARIRSAAQTFSLKRIEQGMRHLV